MAESEGRREHPRYEVSAYVDFTGREHRIQNISLGGICIAAPSTEEVGTVVDVVVNFPEDNSSVALQGEVVWANRQPPMDMGISFIGVDDSKRELLRRYIERVTGQPAGG